MLMRILQAKRNKQQLIIKNADTLKTNRNPRSCGVFFASILKKAMAAAALLFVFYSCTENDELGLDLVDTKAQLNTLDTLTITAMTVPDDSVAMNFGGGNVMGMIDDPVFGKSKASIYTQTRLPMNDLFLGEDPSLDSIHLVLRYTDNHYGALQTHQTIQVHELSESFPEGDTLFSNIYIPYHPDPITKDPEGYHFQPAPNDSVLVDTIMQPPHIRIPLSDAYGQRFIDANDTEIYENVPNYMEEFKGLYVTFEDEMDGIGSKYQMNMLTPMTSLELFYQTEDDTLYHMQRYPINEFARRSTRIEHFGYEDADEALRLQLDHQDQQMADSLLFIQSLGLLRANIGFPFLEELADLPRLLINKAELVMPVDESFSTEQLPAAHELLLLRMDEEGELHFLDDYHMGAGYFGGRLDEDNMVYRFNISKHVQQVMDGLTPNDKLAVVVVGSADNMSRVVLHGPGRAENPMRLMIYYTAFD